MEELLKKQEDFEKTLAAQEEKFSTLTRETKVHVTVTSPSHHPYTCDSKLELQYGCVCMCSRYLYYTVTIEVAVFNIKKYASGTNIGSIQYYPMSCNCIIDCTIIHFGRMPCTVNHFCYSATNRGPQSLSNTSEIYTCTSLVFFTRSPQNSLWFF